MLKLNGGRCVTGILRGFDPFMNVVIDETVEECRDGTKNNIGMVVSVYLRTKHILRAYSKFTEVKIDTNHAFFVRYISKIAGNSRKFNCYG